MKALQSYKSSRIMHHRILLVSCWLGLVLTGGLRVGASTCDKDGDCDESHGPSVFDNPTAEEIQTVIDYMKNQSEFNIVDVEIATINTTYIYLIDGMYPSKSDTLEYLDNNGTEPERNARVVLYRGDLPYPRVEEYVVGPLPGVTSHRLRVDSKRTYSFPYSQRTWFGPVDMKAMYQFVASNMLKVDHILKEVTGYQYNNCSDHCLSILAGTPGEIHTSRRKLWIYLLRKHEGFYLHPVGFQFRVNGESLDPSQWTVDYVWFRGQIATSLDQLVRQFARTTDVRQRYGDPLIYDKEDRNLYSVLDHRGGDETEPEAESTTRPPHVTSGAGRVTVAGHQVEWQGWKFDFAMRSVKGMQLFDVNFKGARIAYEISLAEIGILYGGKTPVGVHNMVLDSQFFFGLESFEVFPDIDCPRDAKFFDFAHYFGSRPMLFKNSACLFEHNNGIPLRRHYDADRRGGFAFVQGMPDNVLILRSIITAYNYDYIYDFTFHQNGVLEVTVSLSGYIQSQRYYTSQQDQYGFQIFPEGIGQIHHHLANFKVDLDITKRENRFETLDFVINHVRDPTEQGSRNYVHSFQRNLRATERDALFRYNFDTPKYLLFHARDEVDQFGNARAYRLYPETVSKLLPPEGWAGEKMFSWARNQVAVTKYKEEEDSSSSIHNAAAMKDPPVDFQDYVDGDHIVDQDLVAWVTLGLHHLPHSEDIPIVQTPGAQLRFFLSPYNFFPEDPSLASRDNIRVKPGKDGGAAEYEYAGEPPSTCGGASALQVVPLVLTVAIMGALTPVL